jgi:hypothetical protein
MIDSKLVLQDTKNQMTWSDEQQEPITINNQNPYCTLNSKIDQ